MNRYYLSNPRFETEGLVLRKLLFLLLILMLGLPAFSQAANNAFGQPSGASQRIGDEDIEPKDPLMATVFSILPGLVFHGSGNIYAGDYENGSKMLVMEIFGGGIALWGHNIIHSPENWGQYFGDSTDQAGYWIKAGGVGLVVASWIWDVATAPGAAESWNSDNQIRFQMDSFNGTGARLAMATRF